MTEQQADDAVVLVFLGSEAKPIPRLTPPLEPGERRVLTDRDAIATGNTSARAFAEMVAGLWNTNRPEKSPLFQVDDLNEEERTALDAERQRQRTDALAALRSDTAPSVPTPTSDDMTGANSSGNEGANA